MASGQRSVFIKCSTNTQGKRIASDSTARRELWIDIHVMLTTGYSARMVVDWLNERKLGFVNNQPWTVDALFSFHKAYAKKHDFDLDTGRPDSEALEIAYLVAMLRAESPHWTTACIVDLFNEQRVKWWRNRPWTERMLTALLHRAKSLLSIQRQGTVLQKLLARTQPAKQRRMYDISASLPIIEQMKGSSSQAIADVLNERSIPHPLRKDDTRWLAIDVEKVKKIEKSRREAKACRERDSKRKQLAAPEPLKQDPDHISRALGKRQLREVDKVQRELAREALARKMQRCSEHHSYVFSCAPSKNNSRKNNAV